MKRWNNHYKDQIIKLSNINIQDQEALLILLQLYYHAGSFINYELSFSKIDNRCSFLTVFDFDILFISIKEVLDNGIKVPDFLQFIRSKFPYTPIIKIMIKNIIENKRYDE